MNAKKLMFLAGICTVILTGCTNVATFDYGASHGTMVRLQEAGSAQKTISVVPFFDQRGTVVRAVAVNRDDGEAFVDGVLVDQLLLVGLFHICIYTFCRLLLLMLYCCLFFQMFLNDEFFFVFLQYFLMNL